MSPEKHKHGVEGGGPEGLGTVFHLTDQHSSEGPLLRGDFRPQKHHRLKIGQAKNPITLPRCGTERERGTAGYKHITHSPPIGPRGKQRWACFWRCNCNVIAIAQLPALAKKAFYRGKLKGLQVLLSRTKRRKEILATMYNANNAFSDSLYGPQENLR